MRVCSANLTINSTWFIKTLPYYSEGTTDPILASSDNDLLQVVLPAGQVEIVTTGHFHDFEDASLILRSDVDAINNLILVQLTKNLERKLQWLER